MRNLLSSVYYVTPVIFMLLISMTLCIAQNAKEEDLIGHWTFEKGEEIKDLTGHFGDIKFNGAEVKDGKLYIGDSKWALTTGYEGPQIGPNKTLVTWLFLDDLNIKRGATIAVNQSSSDKFDAIVYAERQDKRWMAGSSHFRRTQDAIPGFEEKEKGKLIQLAISYEDSDGKAKITIYRNGDIIGDYTLGPIVSWNEGNVEALFGPRALIGGTAHGWIVARIDDARIYNTVLSEDEINSLEVNTLDVSVVGKLTTTWGKIRNLNNRHSL
ncbi:hypothetical protein JT359_07685 [Candidatus Poribacteria bacterium]|nr:hypothetical protein [Candidatus Poribacteria bacterium]